MFIPSPRLHIIMFYTYSIDMGGGNTSWVRHALRAGHFNCLRASAQAILVAVIFLTKSSASAVEISSGGPPSMSSLLGSPWLSKFLKRLALLKLT